MSAPFDRATSEPGGMECMECGVIFVGAEWHDKCAVCADKHAALVAECFAENRPHLFETIATVAAAMPKPSQSEKKI